MTELLLHPKTKDQIRTFLKQPAHALMITGQVGSGKETLARYTAARLAGIPLEKLDDYPYLYVLSKSTDKQEVPIDAVRRLLHTIQLKPAISKGGQAQKLVLIIGAHHLSEEAQNALLKAIEEPPAGTVFILTVAAESDVLPTVASRAQRVNMAPISLDGAQKFLGGQYSENAISSAWSLSQGATGLMAAILEDNQSHPLKTAVDSAKQMLKMSRYERIIFLDNLSRSRDDLTVFLDALSRVLAALQQPAVQNDKKTLVHKIINSRKLTNTAIAQLQKNTSPRLIGLNLALNLSI